MSENSDIKNKKNTYPRKEKSGSDLSNFVFGKVPPQALDLEEAVLGALMLSKDALTAVLDILKPQSFYSDAHASVYRAICNLFEKSVPADLLTVTEELKRMGELEKIGGPYYLVELTNSVTSAANIEFHARIILQKAIQRELIRISTETIKEAYEDTTDVLDLLDKSEQRLFEITEQNMNRGYQNVNSLMAKVIKQIEELSTKQDGLTGVPSGFTNLDRVTAGWQPSDLIIVAARPGMGKTSFTLALALNAAKIFNKGVAFFSLEMSNVQLVNRLISLEAEIESEKLRKGKLSESEWQQLHACVHSFGSLPIYIDDTPGISIFELRAKCRRLKMQHDIQLIIIDYLQLMQGNNDTRGNREQEISQISRSLKGLAKELNVPVIALSQLSRAVETRGGSKRPQLSDLRESGAIEQDADIVSFIYRPEYYGLIEGDNGENLRGIGEIIIAKHRNGSLETVQLKWDGQYAKFSNLEGGYDPSVIGGDSDGNYFGDIEDDYTSLPSKMNTNNRTIDEVPF